MILFSNLFSRFTKSGNKKTMPKLVCGFTIVEFLIVMSIIIVMSLIVFATPRDFFNNKTLGSASNEALTTLSKARSLTLASKDDTSYGVHFETDSVTFFIGPSFIEGAPTNKITYLGDKVVISQISLGGGGDVLFERLSGRALQNGFIIFSQVSGQLKSKTINIYESGLAE